MIVTCENCHASYKLDASVLDPAGSRVRCTNCGHVFIAYPPPEVSPPADDEQLFGAGGRLVAGAVDDKPGLDVEASRAPENGAETAFPSDWNLDEEDDGAATFETDGTDGLELDLDLDFDEAEERGGALTEEIQELDLNLDLEEADTSLAPTAGGDQGLDLDLDLELDGELSEDLLPGRTKGSEDLDLGLEPLGSEPVQTETEVFEQEEIDLGDIDKMLHADEEAMSTEKADPDGDDTGAETDSLGIETAEIAADLVRRASQTEAEVDLYGEETGAPRDRAGDEEIASLGEVYTLRTATDADGQTTLTAEREPIVAREEAMAPPARRRFTWLWVLLVLLGLAGGGVYWAWQQGFDLASLKQLLGQPAADEAGNLKISTLAIDSRFVDNATAGRLFIITGKARNDYDHPRSRIQIKGSLLAKGKRLVGSETVFCGNVLTDLDLNRLEMAEIQRRLDQQTGANDSNLEVPTGGLVPFMVVFSNLPPDLEEFTIEVVSSSR
jgi:predicted Zn finger-like uncharacterized protein